MADVRVPNIVVNNVSLSSKAWDREFETFLDVVGWNHENYWNYFQITAASLFIAVTYLILVFGGQRVMQNKKPFDLRRLWTYWNFTLSAFSLAGFLGTFPELLYHLKQENGFHDATCKPGLQSSTMLWATLFTISKAFELGDTAFVILMKKPLIFLNWGHHSSTMLIVVQSWLTSSSPQRWYISMNYFVHAPMYAYFGIRTLNIKTPKMAAVGITSIQLIQAFIGAFVSGYALYMTSTGVPCNAPVLQSFIYLFMYTSLAYLFADLFYESYIKEKPVKKSTKAE